MPNQKLTYFFFLESKGNTPALVPPAARQLAAEFPATWVHDRFVGLDETMVADRFIDRLQQYLRETEMDLSIRVSIDLLDGPETVWYQLSPAEDRNDIEHPTEPLRYNYEQGELYATDAWKRAIVKLGVEGIVFEGRTDVPHLVFPGSDWWHIRCEHTLGLGLDQPWARNAKSDGSMRNLFVTDRGARWFAYGTNIVWSHLPEQFRKVATLFGKDLVMAQGYMRVLNKHVPSKARFASFLRPTRDGRYKPEHLCCHRDVAIPLQKHGLANGIKFEPIEVVSKPGLFDVDLEAKHGKHIFEAIRNPKKRKDRTKIAIEAKRLASKIPSGSLTAILRFARQNSRSAGKKRKALLFAKQMQKAVDRHEIPKPRAWLKACAMFAEDKLGEFEIFHPRQWRTPEDMEWDAEKIEERNDAPSDWMNVAETMNGDGLFLDLDSVTKAGDCIVFKVSHSSHRIIRRWPTVEAFVRYQALHMCQKRLEFENGYGNSDFNPYPRG